MSYSEAFKDHIANPRNAGELPDANATAEETNPVCGDRLRLSLRLREGRIEAAGFLAYGCPPTLACGSILTELIIGKTIKKWGTSSVKICLMHLVACPRGNNTRRRWRLKHCELR